MSDVWRFGHGCNSDVRLRSKDSLGIGHDLVMATAEPHHVKVEVVSLGGGVVQESQGISERGPQFDGLGFGGTDFVSHATPPG